MSEDPPTRAEFEALLERVEALETQLAEKQRYEDKGLDHRDASVLDGLDEGARVHPRALVELYLTRTDITNRKTAVNRAKQLERRTFFEYDSGEYVFVGVGADG